MFAFMNSLQHLFEPFGLLLVANKGEIIAMDGHIDFSDVVEEIAWRCSAFLETVLHPSGGEFCLPIHGCTLRPVEVRIQVAHFSFITKFLVFSRDFYKDEFLLVCEEIGTFDAIVQHMGKFIIMLVGSADGGNDAKRFKKKLATNN